MTGGSGELDPTSDEGLVLANEFSAVRLRVVRSRGGLQLEVTALESGRSIRLDPLLLESLTWTTREELGRAFVEPHGPAEPA